MQIVSQKSVLAGNHSSITRLTLRLWVVKDSRFHRLWKRCVWELEFGAFKAEHEENTERKLSVSQEVRHYRTAGFLPNLYRVSVQSETVKQHRKGEIAPNID